jgi:hypothetical protein
MTRYHPRHRQPSVIWVILILLCGPIGVVWAVAGVVMSVRWMITGQFT